MSMHESVFGREATGPLAGLVIADFSRVLAGPYCTMLLADMGATVIKVESPAGDETRNYKPPVLGDESTYFLSVNRNKRSIVLDLTSEDDRMIAHDLAARADVVIENFKPGGFARFGLGYSSIAAVNPSVIYASITGFGTTGGADLPGYDLLAQAISGMMDLTGNPGGEPFRAGVAVFDVMTGLHACIGILAALHHRDVTGEGQQVETNLLSSALSGLVNQTGAYALSGTVPTRMGNEHPSLYPYAPFPTSDGQIVIAVGNDSLFRALCAGIGRAELGVDERFATAPARNHNRGELRPILEELLSVRTASEWADLLQATGVPAAPILDVKGGVDTAARLGLEPVVTAGSGARELPGIRNPISFSRTAPSYDWAPPLLNEGRVDVLDWLYGLPVTPEKRNRDRPTE
ncbi:crotonobetainyl-CoA:carnitine CoA-transferase CaiB-like acyl-CoA transferase [Subtercola frigoramans]|uniref:Crotonobetainyl-CoA:carnitine CoA-transferase CaiB-like acyl-CoA transferase n=2 Tax=Subtercola frigoramans TaxID=120298 RepID=A0ABS2L1S0_9MICO|nr:crotonobetainyl-CoA:carnitine CoA-transferase CaiB-like acyl-CoA transferase [Subtercola frigoramans]